MSEKEIKIQRLYQLMERAKQEHDEEMAATLYWAIFHLETLLN